MQQWLKPRSLEAAMEKQHSSGRENEQQLREWAAWAAEQMKTLTSSDQEQEEPHQLGETQRDCYV